MKAKWLVTVVAAMVIFQDAHAQDEERKGFDPNRVFVGGSIGLGLGFGSTTSSFFIGLYPQIGYSITDWLDAGVVINGSFYNEKWDDFNGQVKSNSFTYGTGAFVRTFLFRGLFAQVQPEINWMTYKQSYPNLPDYKDNAYAGSLLVGGGFGSRAIGRSGFYTTIMFDVLNEPNSPYRSYYGNVLPIIQAGFVVYLGQKKQDKYMQTNSGMY